MYYHFETKDDLSLALLERAATDLKESFARGEFYNHGQTIDELSQWLVACIQGGLLTSRVAANQQPFEGTIKIVTRYLTQP